MSIDERLTKRQLEIVCHLANGYTTEETAKMLFLSVSTVKKTLLAARKRVDARTTPHLVSIIIAQGALFWTPDGRSTEEPLEINSNGSVPQSATTTN
jgi:DNA-binding CsgD family transcriptional regulator